MELDLLFPVITVVLNDESGAYTYKNDEKFSDQPAQSLPPVLLLI
ncbi:MAG: hypothetical protein ABI925_11655 [Verrucomicrobiota bacterium]